MKMAQISSGHFFSLQTEFYYFQSKIFTFQAEPQNSL